MGTECWPFKSPLLPGEAHRVVPSSTTHVRDPERLHRCRIISTVCVAMAAPGQPANREGRLPAGAASGQATSWPNFRLAHPGPPMPYEHDTKLEPRPNRSLTPRHKSKSRKRIGTAVKSPKPANGTVVKPSKSPIGTVFKPPDSPDGTVVNPHKPPIGTDHPSANSAGCIVPRSPACSTGPTAHDEGAAYSVTGPSGGNPGAGCAAGGAVGAAGGAGVAAGGGAAGAVRAGGAAGVGDGGVLAGSGACWTP
jgi:hypothetical protein